MQPEALRPGGALGPYPEYLPPSHRGLEAAAQRCLGTATRHLGRRRSAARRFCQRVNEAGLALQGIGGPELSTQIQQLRRELRYRGLVPDLTIRAFALIREISHRTLGLRHHDNQVLGGWVILHGMVAEMDTGEGKTLTAALPAATAALAGIPVHVVTVNDYLARRDMEHLSPLYKVLGLSVGLVTQDAQDPAARQAAYCSDVTYTTNKQLVFDYLRDRVAMGHRRGRLHRMIDTVSADSGPRRHLLLRGLCFGIVDEADSVLIDEARTPLKLSAPGEAHFEPIVYHQALDLARRLDDLEDGYRIDQQARAVSLTARGSERLAALSRDFPEFWRRERRRDALVQQALHALHVIKADQHYLVRDRTIQIIDEHTGRALPDRTWEMGLHQMVEAKEGCEISDAHDSLAQITFQRFFRRYLRLGAMTGTAREVAGELWSVYGLRVIRIPNHKLSRRARCPSRWHGDAEAKWRDVVERTKVWQAQQRPVLLGTRSVAASERLSELLAVAGVQHQVLNARQDHREAEIVAMAGQPGRVTVATNMAGRGTDIRLGPGVAELGGLHVVATEHNEARRIDRQLYGRCGRQGDPGSFEAILSLDDEILELCAPRPIRRLIRKLDSGGLPVTRWAGVVLVWMAQRGLERSHARMRRTLLKMDERLGDALAFTGPLE